MAAGGSGVDGVTNDSVLMYDLLQQNAFTQTSSS
jgi:hypothetical protein